VVYRNRPQNWNFDCAKTPRLIYFMCLYITNVEAHKIDQSRQFSRCQNPILWAIPV